MQGRVERVPGLDTLRAAAVTAVVLYHFPRDESQIALRALSHFGWMGVDLFFVLSGYLIGGQLFESMRDQGQISLRSFYFRRFMRVLPAYYAVLGLHWFWPPDANLNLVSDWRYFVFLQNFDLPRIFTVSWSLCIEEHFYLLFPLVFAWGRPPGRVAARRWFAVVLLAGMIGRAWLWWRHRPDLAWAESASAGFEIFLRELYYPTYTRLDGLAFGVGIAAIRVFDGSRWERWKKQGTRFFIFAMALLLASAIVHFRRMSAWACVIGFPLLSAAFACLVVAAVSDSPLARLRIPGSRFVALSSYSIYLTHTLSIGAAVLLCTILGFAPMGYGQAAVVVASVLFGGALVYFAIERPCLRLRDRYSVR